MDCGTSLVKYILFIFNTIVSVIAILAIVNGVYLLKTVGVIEVDGDYGFPPQALIPIGLITLGSIVLLISFLGCCGAIRESVCMTMCYAVFMLLLLILQLTIVVLMWTNKDEINKSLGQIVDKMWERDAREAGVFEALQTTFHCCGASSAADYVKILKVPTASCCPEKSVVLGACPDPTSLYAGCREKVQDFMSGNTDISKYVGLGLITVELLGFIFACCLANNVRNYKRRNAY